MTSAPAQSLRGSPWPASRPFPWFLVLLGHVISFWKAFDKANKIVRADFKFRAQIKSCQSFKFRYPKVT